MGNKLREPSDIKLIVDGTETTLAVVLADHVKWLATGGKEGKKVDLRWADLRWANLTEADLSKANLSKADLRWADLRGANLREANLSKAYLSGANLSNASLRGAELIGATLSGADLDYSCWPLWCGSLGVKADEALVGQLLFHAFDLAKSSGVDVSSIAKIEKAIYKSSPVTKHGKSVEES